MPKGGARTNSGPPPDPNALRRNRKDDAEWTRIPATVPDELVPVWPLSSPLKRELDLWAAEWRRPQSLIWRRNGQELEVASYVRRLVESEKRGSSAGLGALVQRLRESLLLTTASLRSNRVVIVADEVAEKRDEGKRESSRSRLTVVKPDVAGV